MNAKTIRILSFLGKTAGLVLTVAGPFLFACPPTLRAPVVLTPVGLTPSPRCCAPSGTPVGLTVFAAASFLKDAVNRIGDIADDGKPNDSFKP
jgi:hypothetical protein